MINGKGFPQTYGMAPSWRVVSFLLNFWGGVKNEKQILVQLKPALWYLLVQGTDTGSTCCTVHWWFCTQDPCWLVTRYTDLSNRSRVDWLLHRSWGKRKLWARDWRAETLNWDSTGRRGFVSRVMGVLDHQFSNTLQCVAGGCCLWGTCEWPTELAQCECSNFPPKHWTEHLLFSFCT